MIAMKIRSLVRCAAHDRPLLTLVDRDGGQWHLALWLPANEAERLARVLGLTGPRCVAVFDLVQTLIEQLDGRVLAAELDADERGVGAVLRLQRGGGQELVIPCHPGDAVALAERAGAPILATPATLRYARPVGPEAGGDLAAWLARVRPEDFEARG